MKKFCNIFFSNVYLLFMILFAVSIIGRKISSLYLYITALIIFITFLFLVKKINFELNKKKLLIIIVFAIIIRLILFILPYTNNLSSDYLFFYDSATNFASGENIASDYIALFPYLMPYITILSSFFKLFNSNNYLLVILLNMIFDIFSSILLYKIFRQKYGNQNYSLLACSLWLINPLNLIWDIICCPVVLVNFGIVCLLYVFEKIRKCLNNESFNWKKFIIFSIIYGFLIGVFNVFRPIMIIIILATIIYYLYNIFCNKKSKSKIIFLVLSLTIIFLMYFSINAISNKIISKILNVNVSTTPGWTLFLGSNVEYKGMWNQEASDILSNLNTTSPQEVQEQLKDMAITQYKNNGIKNVKLFIDKFQVMTNFTAGYSVYNFSETAIINKNIVLFLRLFTEIFTFIIILLNIYIAIYYIKNKQNVDSILIYILIIIGLVTSHLLVEVSPRYVLPILPALTIITTISIIKIFYKEIDIDEKN